MSGIRYETGTIKQRNASLARGGTKPARYASLVSHRVTLAGRDQSFDGVEIVPQSLGPDAVRLACRNDEHEVRQFQATHCRTANDTSRSPPGAAYAAPGLATHRVSGIRYETGTIKQRNASLARGGTKPARYASLVSHRVTLAGRDQSFDGVEIVPQSLGPDAVRLACRNDEHEVRQFQATHCRTANDTPRSPPGAACAAPGLATHRVPDRQGSLRNSACEYPKRCAILK